MNSDKQTPPDIVTDPAAPDAPAPEASSPDGEAPKADGPADGPAAAEEAEASDLERLQAERDELNDRLLRTAAELQNFRRRSQEEKDRLAASQKARLLRPLLEVVDDFERSLAAADGMAETPEAAFESLREGVEMVYRKLVDELQRLGVEPIPAEGERFDEHAHEALMQQPAPEDVAPGTVLQEVQRGYRLGDRVLRHSKVIVAADA